MRPHLYISGIHMTCSVTNPERKLCLWSPCFPDIVHCIEVYQSDIMPSLHTSDRIRYWFYAGTRLVRKYRSTQSSATAVCILVIYVCDSWVVDFARLDKAPHHLQCRGLSHRNFMKCYMPHLIQMTTDCRICWSWNLPEGSIGMLPSFGNSTATTEVRWYHHDL